MINFRGCAAVAMCRVVSVLSPCLWPWSQHALFFAKLHHALTVSLAWEGQWTLVFVAFGKLVPIYSSKNWEKEIQRKHTSVSCSLLGFHIIERPRISCSLWEGWLLSGLSPCWPFWQNTELPFQGYSEFFGFCYRKSRGATIFKRYYTNNINTI